MWLLSTDRAELRPFSQPDAINGGYAILSHTWGDNESTLQDIKELERRCKSEGMNPRDHAPEKIRQSCLLAEKHGYRWIWNDTCCIDKTSSAELSEAINSMFSYYASSEVCYAYLEDVPTDCQLASVDSAFRTARWHTRGWTLQELIAPQHVLFLSEEWEVVGNKVELSTLLQEITGVWRRVLTREVHYTVPSIASRMSWASQRQTCRPEDEAYCLMGLFNVNMPTIYGEGRRAFRRLQEELMKQSVDTSLFAWGSWTTSSKYPPVALSEIHDHLDKSPRDHAYVLAHSPRDFARPFRSSTLFFSPERHDTLQPYLPWQWERQSADEVTQNETDSERRTLGPFGGLELPKFTLTHYGLECRFPIIEGDGVAIAVLLCETHEAHVGLLLHPSPPNVLDPTRKRYHTGYGFSKDGGVAFFRLVYLGDDWHNLRFMGKPVTAEWRDIFIASRSKYDQVDLAARSAALNCRTPPAPFRIPSWLPSRMLKLSMEMARVRVFNASVFESSNIIFEDYYAREGFHVVLGTCSTTHEWARAIPRHRENWNEAVQATHLCSEHHIDAWPGAAKDFGDAARTVRLSFTRCNFTSSPVFVLHVELEGWVYTEMMEGREMTIPSQNLERPGPSTIKRPSWLKSLWKTSVSQNRREASTSLFTPVPRTPALQRYSSSSTPE